MDEIDDLTRERLREWQARRLAIKDQMQSQPEKMLELSNVLDLMDDEHAAILATATRAPSAGESGPKPAFRPPASANLASIPEKGRFAVQLNATASSAEDLHRLLELAAYELRRQIDAVHAKNAVQIGRFPGGMSGSLGRYHFELEVNGEVGDE